MSEFRRRLMMQGKKEILSADSYVQDGLIFQVDGIEKGNVSDSWVDLVNGWVFEKNGTVNALNNAWYFYGGGFFNCEGQTFSANSDSTVELCYIPNSNKSSIIMSNPQANNKPYIYKNGSTYTFLEHNKTFTYTTTNGQKYTISMNLSNGCFNGVQKAINSGTDYWPAGMSGSRIRIGNRAHSVTDPFTGTIYAIRFYNRRLTLDEMLYNQRIDNERFNLGLNL